MHKPDGDLAFDLTRHALRVIGERDIPLEWIARTLARPERTDSDATDPELRHALRRIVEHGDRVLRVVYNSTVTPWRVVTVYFDRTLRNRL